MHDSKGNTLHNPQQQIKEITNYFENIFKQENTNPIPDITPQKLKEPISSDEVKEAAKKLKDNKSTGCDNIPAELIKNSPEEINSIIAEILNNIAETGVKPTELTLGQLMPLPKPRKT